MKFSDPACVCAWVRAVIACADVCRKIVTHAIASLRIERLTRATAATLLLLNSSLCAIEVIDAVIPHSY